MKKLTKRKAFNFLRSYFDVLNEIPDDKDKLSFLLAIINKQFLDENPKGLSFVANLSYESQRHQIECSVKGWERASCNTLSNTPKTTPPTPYMTTPPTPKQEEEEEEKEKEKKNIPAIEDFIKYAKTKKPNVNTEAVKNKYFAWIENEWRDGNDREIKNWKTKILNTLQYLKENKNTKSEFILNDGNKIRRGII